MLEVVIGTLHCICGLTRYQQVASHQILVLYYLISLVIGHIPVVESTLTHSYMI